MVVEKLDTKKIVSEANKRFSDAAKGLMKITAPSHYTGDPDVIVAQEIILKRFSDGLEGWLVGKIIGYLARYPFKNGLEDLEKASWYLERLKQKVGSP